MRSVGMRLAPYRRIHGRRFRGTGDGRYGACRTLPLRTPAGARSMVGQRPTSTFGSTQGPTRSAQRCCQTRREGCSWLAGRSLPAWIRVASAERVCGFQAGNQRAASVASTELAARSAASIRLATALAFASPEGWRGGVHPSRARRCASSSHVWTSGPTESSPTRSG